MTQPDTDTTRRSQPPTAEQWHALVVELLHAITTQLDQAAHALRRVPRHAKPGGAQQGGRQ